MSAGIAQHDHRRRDTALPNQPDAQLAGAEHGLAAAQLAVPGVLVPVGGAVVRRVDQPVGGGEDPGVGDVWAGWGQDCGAVGAGLLA